MDRAPTTAVSRRSGGLGWRYRPQLLDRDDVEEVQRGVKDKDVEGARHRKRRKIWRQSGRRGCFR